MMSIVPVTARPTLQVSPDDRSLAIADRADPVQRAFDSRSVVVTEQTDMLGHVVDLGVADVGGIEDGLTVGESRLRLSAEVEHHLEEVAPSLRETLRGGRDAGWERCEEQVELLFP